MIHFNVNFFSCFYSKLNTVEYQPERLGRVAIAIEGCTQLEPELGGQIEKKL